jgi:hybrid cluster-associated redox disulfide protein
MSFLADMTIAELLSRWPETAPVFHRYGMACVGCALESFCSVADAAQTYGLPLEQFLAELAHVTGITSQIKGDHD